jgi:hypothetical protein
MHRHGSGVGQQFPVPITEEFLPRADPRIGGCSSCTIWVSYFSPGTGTNSQTADYTPLFTEDKVLVPMFLRTELFISLWAKTSISSNAGHWIWLHFGIQVALLGQVESVWLQCCMTVWCNVCGVTEIWTSKGFWL